MRIKTIIQKYGSAAIFIFSTLGPGQAQDLKAIQSGDNPYNAKIGFSDLNGKTLIPARYEDFKSILSEGFVIVKKNGKWGYVNKQGKEITGFIYDDAEGFSKGRAIVKIKDKYGMIDYKGKEVVPVIYDFIHYSYRQNNGNYWVIRQGKFGCIDKHNKTVVDFNYDKVLSFSLDYAVFQENEKFGIISVSSNRVIIPPTYTYLDVFSEEGLAMAGDASGRYGFINTKNEMIIPMEYDDNMRFSEGLAAVEKNGKWGIINIKNEIVAPFIYDETGLFKDGLCHVTKNGKTGFINKQGEIVVPLAYDDARNFHDGIAPVQKNKKWGFIDRDGKALTDFKYDDTKNGSEGLTPVKSGDYWGFVDNKGKEVVPCKYAVLKQEYVDGKALVSNMVNFIFYIDSKNRPVNEPGAYN